MPITFQTWEPNRIHLTFYEKEKSNVEKAEGNEGVQIANVHVLSEMCTLLQFLNLRTLLAAC
jgi:hypothetical protein